MNQPTRQPKISFSHFLEKFPAVPLPITLGEEAHYAFSEQNDPLPPLMIEQFILPIEVHPMDDFSEFIPCLRIPGTKDFHAILYWRAMLLAYEYTLAIFDKRGELIDKQVIAGTVAQGELLVSSVATISEDWMIYIVSGQARADHLAGFEADQTTANKLQITPEGQIEECL